MGRTALDSSAHSCSHCRNIQVRIPSEGELTTATDLDQTGTLFVFTEIPGQQVLAASSSCAFFGWAMAGFRKRYTDAEMDDNWTLHGGIHAAHFDHYPSVSFVIFEWRTQGLFVFGLDLNWLAILAEPDNPSAQFISQRPENRVLDSEPAFAQARTWLSVCQSEHHACKVVANSFMPSYIIEICKTGPPAPTIRIIMNPPAADYAALSYCWGGPQPVTATKSTMKAMMSNIPYSTLPKTLQDAVTVTLNLGLRFLWVDALCIIQDDRIHKEQEIAAIPNIYQNACVTISAARSRSCDDGFLHNIVAPGPTATAFKFPFYGPNSTAGSVICFHTDDKYSYLNPIRDRAWPLQEFILSRRILRFGGFQRSWLCLCDEHNGTQGVGNWWKDRDNQEAAIRREFHQTSATSTVFHLEVWSRLVESYSRLKVTNPADRLLAISGMATTLGEKKNSKYLAGIWREHFPIALLWYIASFTKARPDIYIAPSWSWAATNAAVFFLEEELLPDPELKLLTESVILSESKAPYGAVTYGSITVRGLIRRLIWTREGRLSVPDPTGGSSQIHATCFPDYTDSIPTDFIVWCLQISPYNEQESVGPFGLILITNDEKVFYRRGMFEYHPVHHQKAPTQLLKDICREQSHWDQDCELKTIIME